jgi:glycine/D-amino acid oxidase-like deaminating enzyme
VNGSSAARPRYAIVGGGVMGRSLARAFSHAGLAVTLFPGARPGASEVPVALLNVHRGRTGRVRPEDAAALAVTWRLADELAREGWRTGAERSGVVRIADGAKQARSFAQQPDLTPFGAGGVAAPYRAPHGGAFAAGGGWIAPGAWLAALTASAQAHGAQVAAADDVTALERSGGTLRVVTTGCAEGGFDAVLLATGAAPWPRFAGGVTPPFEAVAGDALISDRPAPALPLAGPHTIAPAAAGGSLRAAITGHHRPPSPPSDDDVARLLRAVAWAWPEAEGARVMRVWWGVRAHAAGNRPRLMEVAPGIWWCGALAGRGFLAAAAVAETAVEELVGGGRGAEEAFG